MFSPQARINARTIRKDRITPTTAAAIQLAADFALFAVLIGALFVMADGFLSLASGDLETLHARIEASRGW